MGIPAARPEPSSCDVYGHPKGASSYPRVASKSDADPEIIGLEHVPKNMTAERRPIGRFPPPNRLGVEAVEYFLDLHRTPKNTRNPEKGL